MARIIAHPVALELLKKLRGTTDPAVAREIREKCQEWLSGEHDDLTPDEEHDFGCVFIDARNDEITLTRMEMET